jgi:hypothetical protein
VLLKRTAAGVLCFGSPLTLPLSIGPPEILALDLAAACGSDEYCRQAMAGERKPNAVVDLLRRGAEASLSSTTRNMSSGPGNLLLIEKGRSRAIRAGQDGLRYPSIHIRPGPLQIAGPSRPR